MNSTDDTLFISVHLLASSDLASVNKAVSLYEDLLGPLEQMRIDADTSLLKFASNKPKPEIVAVVSKQINSKPDLPDGHTLAASGQIFIEGVQTLCAATRKN